MSGVQIRKPILGEDEGSYVEVRVVWSSDQPKPRLNVTSSALIQASSKALAEVQELQT